MEVDVVVSSVVVSEVESEVDSEVDSEVVVRFVVVADIVGFVVELSFVLVVSWLVWIDVELWTVEDEIGEEIVELGRGPLLPFILTSAQP